VWQVKKYIKVKGTKTVAIEPVADYQFAKLDELQAKCMESDDLGTKAW
jgi:hypothetical protein